MILTCHYEFVHLHELIVESLQIDHVFFHVVVRRAKEDCEDGLHFPVGVDVELVRERLVVQAGTTCLHAKVHAVLEVLHRHGVVDESVAVVEERVEFIHVDGFEFHSWQLQVALRVLG